MILINPAEIEPRTINGVRFSWFQPRWWLNSAYFPRSWHAPAWLVIPESDLDQRHFIPDGTPASVWQEMYDAAYRAAFFIVEDHDLAHDIAVEALIRVARAEVTPTGLIPYVLITARRLAINCVRRRRKLIQIDWVIEACDHHDSDLYYPDLLPHLNEALEQMPPMGRQIIEMVYLEQKSQTQIANTLGITIAAVNSRIHKARVRLKEILLRLSEDSAA